ncbi:leucyl aminopeptidase family protein [Lysobacter brunescens]|uniref:Leucyl aminopeptidase family protein n=1 Tax=Lysobacter brunescens TaxID=262323 RepID=A0ABW2Y8X5_9GAMM|nr:leucyl aminopeptidase family protein [Lysobacter brunescens]
MTSLPGLAETADHALPLHAATAATFAAWRDQQTPAVQAWLQAQGFTAAAGTHALLPGSEGLAGAVLGVADLRDPFAWAHAPYALPAGEWRMADALDADAQAALQLGWGLGSYRFTRYRAATRAPARLIGAIDAEVAAQLAACARVRDLVNTPTEDMGPADLEAVTREIAQAHGADIDVLVGDDLLLHNFPAIHAVGRASHRDPRLIVLHWGDPSHPHIAIVGKGVCFDTGGLDVKAAAGMRNMKKDMGGAAHAIALAELIMARRLPVRITLLVPAVENALGPNAYRPGEVIATRKGISVEIDNTDAEGRIVLCDALAYAAEQTPQLILDFATLTGAARIALGPDLPVLFANEDRVANDWLDAGLRTHDPLWRMPLHRPYLRYLSSGIADIANGSSTPMAGCITAALYLDRFVPNDLPWAHLDVYSWNDSDRPGRPAGGEAQALRACWAMLKARFG